MADLLLNIRIPSAKVDEYVAHFCYVLPNNKTKADPNWVDPEDGSVAPQIKKYTDKQWVKRKTIIRLRNAVVNGRNRKVKDDIEAYEADDIE